MSSSTSDIARLGSSNYGVWAIRARGALVGKKLQSAIAPADPNNQAAAVDATVNEEALMLLLSLMDDTRIQQNAHHTTAKALWDDLKESYEQSLPAQRSALHREINNLELGNMSINQLMDTAKALQAKLDTLGDKKTAADMVRVVVDSLRGRKEFEVAISSFEDLVAANTPPSMAQMQIKLAAAEQRYNECNPRSQREYGQAKAYVAGTSNGGRGGQRRKQCWVCGSTEHLVSRCPNRYGASSSGQPGTIGQPGNGGQTGIIGQPSFQQQWSNQRQWINQQQTGGDQPVRTLAF